MARKTVDVAKLVDMVNALCKDSVPESKDIRQGAMYMLEQVLHDTGNYHGFRYLISGQCDGAPGVNYLDNMPHPNYELRFKGTDNTRVEYFK